MATNSNAHAPGDTLLAALNGPALALGVGMVFVNELTDYRPVKLHESELWWLIDFGSAAVALDGRIASLTRSDLRRHAADNLDTFVAAARAFCPDLLAACAAAKEGE